MNDPTSETWHEANQRYLAAALAEVRDRLERVSRGVGAAPATAPAPARASGPSGDWSQSRPPAIESLCSSFGLSRFERTVLLMCAGAEMDSRFEAIYAAAQGDSRRVLPTFSLAMAACDDAHWSALSPARPLRGWHLVELTDGGTITTSPLRIAERILHYLAGVPCLDERLAALVKPVIEPGPLAPSHRAACEQIAAVWSQDSGQPLMPVVQLTGVDRDAKRAVAAAACDLLGLNLHAVAAWRLPQAPAEIETFRKLWDREAVLSSSVLLLECDDTDAAESQSATAIAGLMESLASPLIVATAGARRCAHRAAVILDVNHPTESEQTEFWRRSLQPSISHLNGEVEPLVSQFSLSSTAIQSAAHQVVSRRQFDSTAPGGPSEPTDSLVDRLWDACRAQARPRLEGLAQRIEPSAAWDDLVLPENPRQVLRQILVHVRHRTRVYRTWGFASKGSRGLGISALFAGPSGTGKTMAAEVLANALHLDLYRIDLSQVVNKYIGETEKNLSRIFDAAEAGSAVLLFDEADALFGKRSEVKDSHDRYANIEVSYLLQRMEAYRGLAILTTNRKSALDPAFLRRIRFAVEFPFPESAQRAEIWRRVFPGATPTEDLKIDRLARLNVAGGHIRNIAMGAAFLAADAGEPVRMAHLLRAARNEFAKLEKPLTDSEIAGWV
jgi:hypothetical protein